MFLCEIVIVIIEVCKKKNPIQLYTLRHSLVCAAIYTCILLCRNVSVMPSDFSHFNLSGPVRQITAGFCTLV